METAVVEAIKVVGTLGAAWLAFRANRHAKVASKEVTPNGGSSMKDAVNRIESLLDQHVTECRDDRSAIWSLLGRAGLTHTHRRSTD